MAEATAWILKLTEELRVAVAEQQMLHLVDNPVLEDTADATPYCRGLLHWQGEKLAVIDLAALLNHRSALGKTKLIGIFAYSDPSMTIPRFVALAIDNIPSRKLINDNQACALPHELYDWSAYSIACFSDEGYAVPVLNLDAIFTDKGFAIDAASLCRVNPENELQICTDRSKQTDCENMDIQ
jgi:chemotaxis signal transduction protein